MRCVIVCFACLVLAGCEGGGLSCDNSTFVAQLRDVLNKNNSQLYYEAYSPYVESNRSKLPTAATIDGRIADLKVQLQRTRSVCAKQQISAMVCEDMALYPTLESFSQINYDGGRPVAPAEIDVYRANFLPLFNQLNDLQKQKAGDYSLIQQRENELRAAFNESVRYEVGLFHIKMRNDQTGAVACEARVSISASSSSWSKDILYTLENTTDGRLYYELQSQL